MSNLCNKQWWLSVAEVIDAFRLWPRFMLTMYWVFLWDVHYWYTSNADPDSGLMNIYANLVFGGIGVITGLYLNSGRKWT